MSTLQIGNGNWSVKEDALLGYNINDYSGKYYPRDIAWTRASDAWRTTSSGLIQRTPWNLLQQSEDFSNAVWGKQNATITANTTTAPNGTNTADKLVETTATSTHIIFTNISQSSTNRRSQTYSFYAKASERSWIATSGDMGTTYFNLSTGQVGTVTTSTFWFSGITASMEDAGNGWYRCTLSGVGFFEFNVGIKLATANGTDNYTGNGTSGVFIWGAQLVEGSAALDYLPTTDRLNVGRVDYAYTSRGAMLLEPQRTNLIKQSQAFNDTGYWGVGNTTITANAETSPDGTTSAESMTIIDSTSQVTQTLSLGAGTYTASVWVKSLSGTPTIRLRLIVDTVVTSQNIVTTSSWQRVTFTFTATTSVTAFGVRGLTGSGEIAIYGAQLEVGTYSTTYIQTGSTSVTRLSDAFTRSNIFTNGYISSAGGTWYVELVNNISYLRDGASSGLYIDTNANGQSTGIAFLSPSSGGRMRIWKVTGGSFATLYNTTTDTTKIAIKWNGTTADIFANGTKVVSATSFTTTNMEYLGAKILDVPYYIPWMTLYSTPLSDAECAFITTL